MIDSGAVSGESVHRVSRRVKSHADHRPSRRNTGLSCSVESRARRCRDLTLLMSPSLRIHSLGSAESRPEAGEMSWCRSDRALTWLTNRRTSSNRP
jgi:hypothetical protein